MSHAAFRIADAEVVLLVDRHEVGAVLHVAQDAADVDRLPGPVGGLFGVEVTPGAESGTEGEVLEDQAVGGHAARAVGEDADPGALLEVLEKVLAEDAVFAGRAGAEDLLAIARHDRDAGRRGVGETVRGWVKGAIVTVSSL